MTAALAAIVSVWVQNNSTRTTLSVDLIFRLNEEFDSPRAKDHRREAAAGLLKGEIRSQLYSVMDFFDGAGLLLRRKAIHEDILFENFAQSPLCYWFSAKAASRRRAGVLTATATTPTWSQAPPQVREAGGRNAEALHDENRVREFLTEESNLF